MTTILRWATQLHPVTGQEVADLEDVAARPLTGEEREGFRQRGALANARGRNLYLSVDHAWTTGGYLLASAE